MVLHLGDEDLVTRAEHEPLVLGAVAVGAALEKAYATRLSASVAFFVKTTSSAGAPMNDAMVARAASKSSVRLLGELVRAAVHRGVVLLVERALGVEHRRRLVRRRPRVEVDERAAAAHRARQDREVAADRGELPVREGQASVIGSGLDGRGRVA